MLRRYSSGVRCLSLILILGCNQGKPQSNVTVTQSPEKKDDRSVVTETPGDANLEEEEVPLARVTEEPKCVPVTAAQPGEGKSELNAAGDFLSSVRDIYTGFDGKHSYRVPSPVAYTMGLETATAPSLVTTPPTIVIEDPSIASVVFVSTPADYTAPPKNKAFRFAMVTSKKPGTTKVTFSLNGLSSTSKIYVAAYKPEQYELGKKRYMSPDQADSERVVCSTCHGATTTDHDPLLQGILSEPNLLLIAGFGKRCDDAGTAMAIEGLSYHKWHFTKEELQALPAYLRAIPPKGF